MARCRITISCHLFFAWMTAAWRAHEAAKSVNACAPDGVAETWPIWVEDAAIPREHKLLVLFCTVMVQFLWFVMLANSGFYERTIRPKTLPLVTVATA